jgi:hypothetical protein
MAVVSEFSTISYVTVKNGPACADLVADPRAAERCELTGTDRHSWAFALLGVFAVLMAWGTAVGRSRPAAAALVLVGLVILAIGLFSDLPEAGRTGFVGEAYNASAHKGTGLWLELIAGALMVAVGAVALLKLLRPAASEPSSDAAREPAAA